MNARDHRAASAVGLAAAGLLVAAGSAGAQPVLFDFDNAPIHSPLPINLTIEGIEAHFSATGQNYSIQYAYALGWTPAGFSGLCLYPNSIFPSDVHISFSQTLTAFSILYTPQEMGCENDSATMRVTAYRDGAFVGTQTATAPVPGTWPTGTLAITLPQGFNRVVVHYDSPPPTCEKWGPIYLADNMWVTPAPPPCYPDCDASGALNVNDYICFQTRFALGDPYSDCDANGVRNVNDYICFQTRFALGCR